MSWQRLWLLGVITFCVMLALNWPASRLLVAPDANKSSLQFFGIEGTLRAGSVQGLSLNNRALLENLRWRLSPWQLLLLRLGYQVNGGAGDDGFSAQISRSALGYWRVQDFNGGFTLQALAVAAGQSYLPLQGRAQLELAQLQWKQEQPLSAEGTLHLRDLRWTLSATPLPLGDYEATFLPKGNALEAKITTLSGLLEVEGDATFKSDRSYEYHLQLRPKTGADPALHNLLLMWTKGPPDTQAWYHLRLNGSL